MRREFPASALCNFSATRQANLFYFIFGMRRLMMEKLLEHKQ